MRPDKVYVEEARAEFELMRQLKMDSVVKYYDFNPDAEWTQKDGKKVKCCYLVMERVQGVELLEFLNEMKDTDQQLVRTIGLKVLKAIHELHRSGIFHADIKLENVMITTD